MSETETIPQEESPGEGVRPKHRVTVVEYIQFQEMFGGSAILPAGTPYAYEIQSEELPFQRKFKAGSDWKPMPGINDWMDGQVGLIKVENVEGLFLQTIPTESERQDIAGRIIDVGIQVGDGVQPFAEVHPGRSIRIEAHPDAVYLLRARQGTASYWLHVFPR